MKAIVGLALLLAFMVVTIRAQVVDRHPESGTLGNPEEKKICVLGNVVKPAMIPFRAGMTVTQAIKEAGGIPADDRSREVRVFSLTTDDVFRVIDVDLEKVKKRPYLDLRLQSFDIVEVVFSSKKKIPANPYNPCHRPLKPWG